jgi:hypothetical protein
MLHAHFHPHITLTITANGRTLRTFRKWNMVAPYRNVLSHLVSTIQLFTAICGNAECVLGTALSGYNVMLLKRMHSSVYWHRCSQLSSSASSPRPPPPKPCAVPLAATPIFATVNTSPTGGKHEKFASCIVREVPRSESEFCPFGPRKNVSWF